MPNAHPVDLKSLSTSLSAAVSTAARRVVAVHSGSRRPSSGIIWQTGLVVTAEEALDHEEDFRVTFPSGNTLPAEIVGRDPSTDVGLLRIATDDSEAWAQSPTPRVGSLALVVGRGDESPIASLGLVAEVGGAWRSMRGGRIDARIRLGLSLSARGEGGAVIAPDGSLIGLAVIGPRGRALAIPSSTVAKAVAALLERGYVARGFLGFELQSLHRRGGGPGVIVVQIEPSSPAEQAGFVVGDIITTWDGELIRSLLVALRGRPEFRLVSIEDEIPAVIVTDRPDVDLAWDGDGSILLLIGAQARQSAVRPVAAVLPTEDARLILSAAHVIATGYAARLAGANGGPQHTIANESDELAAPRRADLSSREREVLELLVDGASNKEIARRLGISVHTAKFHVAAVLEALRAKNRSDAVAIGFRDGYISM